MTGNPSVCWRDGQLEGTEFLVARYTDFAFAPHLHETYAIGIIEAGGQLFRPERRSRLIMPAGRLCVINPGIVHEGRAATDVGWTYRMFYPAPDLVARAFGDLPDPTGRSFDTHVLDDQALYRAFARLHLASQAHESVLERESRGLVFLRELFVRHAAAPPERHPVREDVRVARVRDYLRARWNEPVRVAELAAETGLTETHVIRAFASATGLPPHAYQTALKVERAKAMIGAGTPLAEAATAAGFYDQSQMTRHFRRLVGMTPGRYARATGATAGIAKTAAR